MSGGGTACGELYQGVHREICSETLFRSSVIQDNVPTLANASRKKDKIKSVRAFFTVNETLHQKALSVAKTISTKSPLALWNRKKIPSELPFHDQLADEEERRLLTEVLQTGSRDECRKVSTSK
ncbi:hypothetical protein AVEN_242199-1 [Araneus ventricosus]|uniref:Uncharacterized protein n=1 Tax=Araneus ventricosus TaxID=182803 RepID=A0A4Y2V4E5_ARAVE|nr:hypothetical protein AVEN_217091-1 [Araneus ventricosus]GBO20113.1 hypothetical protein AVEN_242199-1 [Araneus ventricosus]